MKTRIYVADTHINFQLSDFKSHYDEAGYKDCINYPEMGGEYDDTYPNGIKQILEYCPELVGYCCKTLSEYVILWMIKQVRIGKMAADDLEIMFIDDEGKIRRIRVSDDGELLDPWPGGFFEERGVLLFKDE